MRSGGKKKIVSTREVTDGITRFVQVLVVVLAATFLVILVSLIIINGRPESGQLRFSPYALLSIVSLVSNLVALTLILRIKQRTDSIMWFCLFLVSVAVWAGAEAMTRLSATPEAAAFWSSMTVIGSVALPMGLYMFALTYIDPRRAKNPWVFPALALVYAVFVYVNERTNLLYIFDPNLALNAAWGYHSPTGPAYILLVSWIILLVSASFVLFFRFHKRTIEPTLRKQSRLFMIAIAIPLATGAITEGLLPILHVTAVPRLTIMFMTISAIIISYSILRYRFFSLTPAVIAGRILDTMNEAVIGIKPDLSLNFVNSGAERMFGLSSAQLAGKRLSDFMATDWTPQQLQHNLFDPLKNEDRFTLDAVEFHTAEGQTIITKLSISSVYDEDQPYGYLVVLTDITAIAHTKAVIEREVADRTNELNQEHARLQSAINSLDIGLLMTFEDQSAISYNAALPHILSISDGQDQEHKIDIETLQTKLLASQLDLKAAIGNVQSTGQPFHIKEASYDNRILTIFGAPIMVQLDKIIGTVVLIEDITEQKVVERSKDEFFSIASHELRTPLTSIKGNTSMILDFYKEQLQDPQLKEMVTDVHDSSVRLIEIVNDFLDTSRLEQGKMNFEYEEVSLEEVVESVAYEMKQVLNEKKLYLKVADHTLDRLPKVWVDKNRLKQVVYNLVGNAAKFTEEGGITISAEKENKFIKVDVTDTGRGMSPEAQKLLFHKFQQAGSSLITRDTTRGTGLGLYISKMIVESMGGNIALTSSTEGQGTTFSFEVPVATDAIKSATITKLAKESAQTDSSTGMTSGEPTT
ncbi:MAG: ATP-binding protein [Patescibacteria group bacterium]